MIFTSYLWYVSTFLISDSGKWKYIHFCQFITPPLVWALVLRHFLEFQCSVEGTALALPWYLKILTTLDNLFGAPVTPRLSIAIHSQTTDSRFNCTLPLQCRDHEAVLWHPPGISWSRNTDPTHWILTRLQLIIFPADLTITCVPRTDLLRSSNT